MRKVFYVTLFVIVIVSWGVFARERRAQRTDAPAQTTTSIESPQNAK